MADRRQPITESEVSGDTDLWNEPAVSLECDGLSQARRVVSPIGAAGPEAVGHRTPGDWPGGTHPELCPELKPGSQVLQTFANVRTTEDLDFWPSGNDNGYAFYHRVDGVNGGDMNPTHTTGFSKKQNFWYK
ncbi:hypothetical protein GUITHDRAFT_133484 [Guillardia theta CCMP2712]|uniref:Uncharacterized protein n=1 Tax=Guillardia theta (strain CCMP2712) TaxID=905079 RepID=L1JXP5_GUITC|nr:hypothetical protein GUITHDRAFT_133484 [Guillardia theta CCMP2712]EKX53114.1 hypothetical protein GUITHDRAFT_133484 [Guillardia theta CCMP2712]|eukprot:XP_005840094.1 hypothetical protein GUITHDRAFT_133484 [Guillardia theta CCMP2712]